MLTVALLVGVPVALLAAGWAPALLLQRLLAGAFRWTPEVRRELEHDRDPAAVHRVRHLSVVKPHPG